ncbi:hypothetical protein G7Y89_g3898 [Cudoniella acicularis]|uniref:NmrA-like domain-containing protein n=1 Tax=Cudoniella acicularis TaxID=354080 RepID=A0A8H4RRU2_9HELO|nr:hypothetical protein G7Y89_g3898 [Cudoniella acicularis]
MGCPTAASLNQITSNLNAYAMVKVDVTTLTKQGLDAVQVKYTNKAQLVELLRGVHAVLSFVVVASDPGNVAQKNLIDASIEAGVKIFAPNEWSTRSNSGVSWYEQKDENRRAIVFGDGDARITSTTVQDLAAVVAPAIDYEGDWPETGGIRGGQITVAGSSVPLPEISISMQAVFPMTRPTLLRMPLSAASNLLSISCLTNKQVLGSGNRKPRRCGSGNPQDVMGSELHAPECWCGGSCSVE